MKADILTKEEHQHPVVRVCDVIKPEDGGSCGFHLTRTKWDPYPWVCGVDDDSPAKGAGLQVGDCVLEVNGEDVLGQKVSDIAAKVRARDQSVTMLLWNSGRDSDCDPESLCCGPMPTSLQRLSACMNSILSVLECPVCLDTIPPPAHQCENGHLICVRCRAQSERCPVCRLRNTRGRNLLADKVFNSLSEAFNLNDEPPQTKSAKIKQRLVGKKNVPEIKRPMNTINFVTAPKNKFLSRILGKSSSVENLSSSKSSHGLVIDSSFNSPLKTKSLSSNEIFNANNLLNSVDSVDSRTSMITCNDDVIGLSSQSFQGSLNSITHRITTDFEETEQFCDGASYYCPFSDDCASLLKRPSIFKHLKHDHCGPLVQYHSFNVSMDLPPRLPDHAVVNINNGSSVYFLKILSDNESDYLIWMWVLAGKFMAENLKLIITLKTEDPDSPELIFKAPVYSLSNTSWAQIIQSKKGVVIKKETVEATFKRHDVKLSFNVTSKATEATVV